MRLLKSIIILSFALLLSACTSSGYRDFNVADSSATFSNIEVSKTFNERWRVQLESSIATTKGSTASYESPDNHTSYQKELILDSNGNYTYDYYDPRNSVGFGGIDYPATKISYDYSINHKTISGGFDFFHTKHVGLILSMGLSQYDYSVTATLNGTLDASRVINLDDPIIIEDDQSQTTIYKYRQLEKVTNKQLSFDFTDYGFYVALEPHFQFNDQYSVSARFATSTGKYTSIGTNLNSEISLRFNYIPVEHVEMYLGYQFFSIGNALDSNKEIGILTHLDGQSRLSIDTRGLLGGFALRF